jgi:hypothetical protein
LPSVLSFFLKDLVKKFSLLCNYCWSLLGSKFLLEVRFLIILPVQVKSCAWINLNVWRHPHIFGRAAEINQLLIPFINVGL